MIGNLLWPAHPRFRRRGQMCVCFAVARGRERRVNKTTIRSSTDRQSEDCERLEGAILRVEFRLFNCGLGCHLVCLY